METTQGAKANFSGSSFEELTKDILLAIKKDEKDFFNRDLFGTNLDILTKSAKEELKNLNPSEKVSFKREIIQNFVKENGSSIVKRYPYLNIGDREGETEFGLCSPDKFPIRIECRYQEVPGSVIEKIPNLFLSCRENEETFLLLLFGGKYSLERKDYIEAIYRNMTLSNKIKIIFFENNVEKFKKEVESVILEFWE